MLEVKLPALCVQQAASTTICTNHPMILNVHFSKCQMREHILIIFRYKPPGPDVCELHLASKDDF